MIACKFLITAWGGSDSFPVSCEDAALASQVVIPAPLQRFIGFNVDSNPLSQRCVSPLFGDCFQLCQRTACADVWDS